MYKYIKKLVENYGILTGCVFSPVQRSDSIRASFDIGLSGEYTPGSLQQFDLKGFLSSGSQISGSLLEQIKQKTDEALCEDSAAGVFLYVFRALDTCGRKKQFSLFLVKQTLSVRNPVEPQILLKRYSGHARDFCTSLKLESLLISKLNQEYQKYQNRIAA
ncbi:hypothetical protein BOO92_14025 [Vibrio navarrensis]|uniref:hypothetical protein n=1 Tax=Vibrio navarrensis TaxID=29495 RepID=UPI001867FF27|nr:hypothetical protein [Vibrio navarrensis]MBE3657795.1 hypothetical protein [Vibrio navarrensis]